MSEFRTIIEYFPKCDYNIDYSILTVDDKRDLMTHNNISYEIGYVYHNNPTAERVVWCDGYFYLREDNIWYRVWSREKGSRMYGEHLELITKFMKQYEREQKFKNILK